MKRGDAGGREASRHVLSVVDADAEAQSAHPSRVLDEIRDGLDDLGLDPLLIALLKKIPSADKGWPAAQRVRWFRTFAMNVSQIYDGDGEPVEMKIDLESGPK